MSRGRAARTGRSPLARRSPHHGREGLHGQGSISARAEEPDGVHDVQGSISARAEEPCTAKPAPPPPGVDLRSRGGAHAQPCHILSGRGRSPLARRSPPRRGARGGARGSISARAEEPARVTGWAAGQGVDLRSRGGATQHGMERLIVGGRSPLARRSPPTTVTATPRMRSISARAEEPCSRASSRCRSRVDLRSRGGAVMPSAADLQARGRSPLARRSPW